MEELEDLICAQDPLIVFLSETWFEKKEQLDRLHCKINMLAFSSSLVRVGAVVWLSYGRLIMSCGWTVSQKTTLTQ